MQYEGNETRIARVWSLYPLSKLSSTTTQFEAFATYLMLMLFIAIVAFVSAVMVIGLKLISTIWDDAAVYENLRRLGMKQKKIKGLITKQMLFVYFIPTVLGCLIGAFTTYRIIKYTVSAELGASSRNNHNIVYSLDFDVTPHQLRHTYITNLTAASVDPKTVQYLAGHENSKTTMDIYAKVKYNKPSELAPVVNSAFIREVGA